MFDRYQALRQRKIKSEIIEEFKLSPGLVVRARLVYINNDKIIFRAAVHNDEGTFLLCKTKSDELKRDCCYHFGESEHRFGIVLLYKDQDELKLAPWFFTHRDYVELKKVHEEWDLTTNDFMITESIKRKQIVFVGIANSIFDISQPEIKKRYNQIRRYIKENLAKKLTLGEISELIKERNTERKRLFGE